METRNSPRFADKTALVTGASSGIGKAFALLLLSDGAHVAIGDVKRPEETWEALPFTSVTFATPPGWKP